MATQTILQTEQTNPYEDLTCAECGYGAIDNRGQCVINTAHLALSWTRIVPNTDGYYWWRTRIREQLIELFEGLFYVDQSRYGLTADYMRERGGEFLGPVTSRQVEDLLNLRMARRSKHLWLKK